MFLGSLRPECLIHLCQKEPVLGCGTILVPEPRANITCDENLRRHSLLNFISCAIISHLYFSFEANKYFETDPLERVIFGLTRACELVSSYLTCWALWSYFSAGSTAWCPFWYYMLRSFRGLATTEGNEERARLVAEFESATSYSLGVFFTSSLRIFPDSYAATGIQTHFITVALLLRDLNPGCFTGWAT